MNTPSYFVLGLSLMLAVSCVSGDGNETNESASSGSSEDAAGGRTATSDSSAPFGGADSEDAGSDDSSSDDSSSDDSSSDDSSFDDSSSDDSSFDDADDPYCPHAWNGFEQLDVFVEETNAIQNDPDMSRDTLNAHGDAAHEAAELTGQHFGRAEDFVVETEISEAFDALLRYQETYMVPHAQLAATATDVDDHSLASLMLLQEDGVADAVARGVLASGTVSAYTLERCGSARWP